MMGYDFNKHILHSQVISNSLWDYEILILNENVKWAKEKDLYIEWEESFNPYYELRYNIRNINEELIRKFQISKISSKQFLLMTFGSSNPILKFETNYFIFNWEELVFLSRDASIVWSEDSELIMEFSGRYDKLYSNFKI